MNWTDAEAVAAKPSGGATINAFIRGKRGPLCINVNALAQEEHFGGSIIGERFDVQWAYSNGLPHLRLLRSDTGVLTAAKSMRGTARITIARFGSGLPDEKTGAAACTGIEACEDTGAISFALPETMRLPKARA